MDIKKKGTESDGAKKPAPNVAQMATDKTRADRGEIKSEPKKEPDTHSETGPKPNPKPNLVKISIDNTPEEVIQYDTDGVKLEFEHANGRFLRLPSEVTRSLSYENKQRYFVSKGMFEETLSFDHYDRRKFPPKQGFATATDRLDVKNKNPRMHYCWKRPDELRQAQMDGYRPVSDDSLDTFGGDVSSTRTVGAGGDTELVLMEIPKETKDQQRAANKEKDQKRRQGVESSTVDDMIRSGGKPFIPKEE